MGCVAQGTSSGSGAGARPKRESVRARVGRLPAFSREHCGEVGGPTVQGNPCSRPRRLGDRGLASVVDPGATDEDRPIYGLPAIRDCQAPRLHGTALLPLGSGRVRRKSTVCRSVALGLVRRPSQLLQSRRDSGRDLFSGVLLSGVGLPILQRRHQPFAVSPG